MRTQGTRPRVMRRTWAAGTVAVLAMALSACQTPTDEPGGEPSTTAASPAPSASEPATGPTASATPEPTASPGAGAPVVNGPNSITSPLPGETVQGPSVTATGEGTAFEAVLSYRVLAAGTQDVVVEDFTMAGSNGDIGPWTIELTLDPGEYTLQVWEADMSDGESTLGPYRNLVEVTFTVQ